MRSKSDVHILSVVCGTASDNRIRQSFPTIGSKSRKCAAGLSAVSFVVCSVEKVYYAAGWGFVSGMINFLTSQLMFLKVQDRLNQLCGLSELESIFNLGFAVMSISISGFVYHSVYCCLAIYHSLDVSVAEWAPIPCALYSILSAILLCCLADREQRGL